MVLFAVELQGHYSALKFMRDTDERLNGTDFFRNPFTGGVLYAHNSPNKGHSFVVVMDPIYPKIWIMGFLWLLGAFLLGGSFGWYIPGLVMAPVGILWSAPFMYTMLRIGIRKAGYVGPIKLLRNETVLRRLQSQKPLRNDKRFSAMLKGFEQENHSLNGARRLEDG